MSGGRLTHRWFGSYPMGPRISEYAHVLEVATVCRGIRMVLSLDRCISDDSCH